MGGSWRPGHDDGVLLLPGGAAVRGRAVGRLPTSPADLAVLLAPGPPPPWPHVRLHWPDFWVPLDGARARAVLGDAHRRARAGERVEIACRGGVGRTGTALAALCVLDGLCPAEAVAWVPAGYRRSAVETPWQRAWPGAFVAPWCRDSEKCP